MTLRDVVGNASCGSIRVDKIFLALEWSVEGAEVRSWDGDMIRVDDNRITKCSLSANRTVFTSRRFDPPLRIFDEFLAFRHTRQSDIPLAFLQTCITGWCVAAILVLGVEPLEEVVNPIRGGGIDVRHVFGRLDSCSRMKANE